VKIDDELLEKPKLGVSKPPRPLVVRAGRSMKMVMIV
jgi:hypothetical protein